MSQSPKFAVVECRFSFESASAVKKVKAFARYSSIRKVDFKNRTLIVQWICENQNSNEAVQECRELVDFNNADLLGVDVVSDVRFVGYSN